MRVSRGFTLLEIVVALAVAGGVLAAAQRILGSVLDATGRLEGERVILDGEANGVRLLQSVLGSIDLVSPGASPFAGTRDQVQFSAWSAHPTGRLVLRRFGLAASDSALVLSSDAFRIATIRGVRNAEFDYLLNPGADEAWVRGWASPVSPPVAIRIRVTRASRTDTLLLIVGPRG